MKLTLLAGGVGGGRMADGFYQHCQSDLTVIVNVGDDFELHGLKICPDLDTVLYTMAGLGHVPRGWGLAEETFSAHQMWQRLGLPDWFRLGDGDLALQVVRSHWLRQGLSLTDVTGALAGGLGVTATLLPMSDQPVSTWVETEQGLLSFQDYFVRRQHQDPVLSFEFRGLEEATPGPDVLAAMQGAEAVVLAPSNPFVSLDPILALPQVGQTLAELAAPRVAVSPIIGGQAVKGPAAHMMRQLGWEASCAGIASYYRELIDGVVIDAVDQGEVARLQSAGLKVLCVDTIMLEREDRGRLAADILDWLQREF